MTSHPPSFAEATLTTPTESLKTHVHRLQAHKHTSLYRLCGGITSFPLQDPDPYAADHGSVLGLRIEAFDGSSNKYLRPYYVFLVRDGRAGVADVSENGSALQQRLRVHRHTLPPCIPLAALAKKYLPRPPLRSTDEGHVSTSLLKSRILKQDLPRFARALRREIVAYHNRRSAITYLRRGFGLAAEGATFNTADRKGKGKAKQRAIKGVEAVDAEATMVRLEWVDGRIGRLVVGNDGVVGKSVVFGEDGREGDVEVTFVGRPLESLGEVLTGSGVSA